MTTAAAMDWDLLLAKKLELRAIQGTGQKEYRDKISKKLGVEILQ